MGSPHFKIATEDWEFEQIHRLNYETFVEEIPEHVASASRRLVDRFHDENTYAIGLDDRRLVGMLAIRGRRPFSLDLKLPNLDEYLPQNRSICELRLLAIDRAFRGRSLLRRLLALALHHCLQQAYDLAIISGTTRQLKLYRHLGFVPFGPLVGKPWAQFQPMFLTREALAERTGDLLRDRVPVPGGPAGANFLPGPVVVRADVREAFERQPASHRADEFVADLDATRVLVCRLGNARHVEILLGSGTLANDAIAGQLGLDGRPGLVLSNGEFGERLIDHARRARLAFDLLVRPWGEPFEGDAIETAIGRNPSLWWVWFVHCETSTGVLNDLDSLKRVCTAGNLRLCVDAISSFGAVPVDLAGVFLAAAVSGKALRAFPGLSMVFHDHDIEPAPGALPRYLDLGLYARAPGSPFTHSSNLVRALQTAVAHVDWPGRFQKLHELSVWLRTELESCGFEVVGRAAQPAPGIVTIQLPAGMCSAEVGQGLEEAGYLVSHRSDYLVARSWIQIGLMGEMSQAVLSGLLATLDRLCCGAASTGRAAVTSPLV